MVEELHSNRFAKKFEVIRSKYKLLAEELKKAESRSRITSKQNQKVEVKYFTQKPYKKMEVAQEVPFYH